MLCLVQGVLSPSKLMLVSFSGVPRPLYLVEGVVVEGNIRGSWVSARGCATPAVFHFRVGNGLHWAGRTSGSIISSFDYRYSQPFPG